MNRRTLTTLAFLATGLFAAPAAEAQTGATVVAPLIAPIVQPVVAVRRSESAVRQLPLEKRPNRLGHFYGNTVRRRKTGTFFVNRQHSDRPLARYLYIAR